LKESDYVTLHLPLTAETRNLIDAQALATMKPNAILINAARGGLVDEAALVGALRNGVIAGAGLYVFLAETDSAFRPVADELLSLPNVIATPHAAGSTREGLARTNMIASRSVVAVLDGQSPPAACVVADGRSSA
jgi:D-3-phosphoglycerate dehydrogenase